jgi:5-methyltetrahydrofolate--homocysteine methyltransferase
MLEEIIETKSIQLKGIIGFYPCNQVDEDDIQLWDPTNEEAKTPVGKLHGLRQQLDMSSSDHFLSMSDFVAPKSSGRTDYVGMFAVSAGFGQEALCKKYIEDDDEYNNMLIKTITDRLAEAFAEELHTTVRRETWGYSPTEELTPAQCLNVQYQGIRPAPGYPTQPDHTEKTTMWDLMDIKAKTGIELTESLAMTPASSVSGMYFGNKHAHYFAVQEICKD